ncbi:MAG: spore coat associated protein CotJA [Clostridia bacterium]|nr:spore coat associated protein CotJA [Clostridia bacterium]
MEAGNQVLAMAYVHSQPWAHLYSAEEALHRGTLFAQLDLPFEGGAHQ